MSAPTLAAGQVWRPTCKRGCAKPRTIIRVQEKEPIAGYIAVPLVDWCFAGSDEISRMQVHSFRYWIRVNRAVCDDAPL